MVSHRGVWCDESYLRGELTEGANLGPVLQLHREDEFLAAVLEFVHLDLGRKRERGGWGEGGGVRRVVRERVRGGGGWGGGEKDGRVVRGGVVVEARG